MADTIITSDAIKERFLGPLRKAAFGRRFVIPIRLSPEARARRDWTDAVRWLEARQAAREEWPWPER